MTRQSLRTPISSVFVPAALVLCSLAAAGEATRRDLIRVQQKSTEEPWLRINAGGHTGTVQALAFTPDSKRLCSAGLDKNVLVWNLTALQRDLRRTSLRERTIRWQVARSLRGSVYALASAPSDGLLAFGGYGAMGSLGEILLVEPLSGDLVQALDSHRQTVWSLAFSADGNALASSDLAGQAVLWRRDGWKPTVLARPDDATYGAEAARLIANQPKLRPIAVVGNQYVVIPAYQGLTDGRLRWKLKLLRLDDPQQTRTLDTLHDGLVTVLAASPDGTKLASADMQGHVFVWDLAGEAGGPPTVLDTKPSALSLCFSPDGKKLVVGTRVRFVKLSQDQPPSEVQVWDLAAEKLVHRRSLPDHVNACAVSPNGKLLAYTGGQDNEISLESLESLAEPGPPSRYEVRAAVCGKSPFRSKPRCTGSPGARSIDAASTTRPTWTPRSIPRGWNWRRGS